jgi:mono/diheme cytochrome c family protein
MSRQFLFCALFLGGGLLGTSNAGDAFKPGKLSKEEIARLQPGLTLRFHGEGYSHVLDSRRVRLAALHVPEGSPASVLLRHEDFKSASLQGLVKLPLGGGYNFKLVGTGDAVLRFNGQEVAGMKQGVSKESAVVDLVKGYNKIEVHYFPPAKGDAAVRVCWMGEGFAWEPLPPDLLFSRKDDAELTSAATLRDGRLLFATHGCVRCHGLPGELTPEKCQMPELKQQAPSLANAGNRLRYDWLAAWIADPHALRPEATMPRVLHGTPAGSAEDLAAYVTSLHGGKPFDAGKADAALAVQGEKLFFNLGCITCHQLQDPKEKDKYGRLSLYYVNAKFAPGALEAFLRAPQAHYPWIRMPDFKLTANETAALAAYLGAEAKGKVSGKRPAGSAERGAKLFAAVGCAQCHAVQDSAALPKPSVTFPKLPVRGCLADAMDGRGKAPDFVFTDAQRLALRALLSTGGKSLTQDSPAEFSMRQVKLLQCNACHSRDGQVSRWYAVLTEEGNGVQPEYLPHLTWTGEKLHPDWTEKMVAGTHDHCARPWLKARMPAFPARAAILAVGLSHEHGYALKEGPRPQPDAKLAAVGEKLLPQVGGFNCIQCHAVGSQKAVAPFEAEGINLADAAVRLRYDFYARWMLDPTRVDPTTRMTRFTMDGKTTALMDVLDGDAHRQFDAIWHYIQTLPGKAEK